MKNKELESKISSAVSSMVPFDTFEKISEKIIPARQSERTRINMTVKTGNKIKKFVFPAIAACFILVAGIFGTSYYINNFTVDSIIDIDVNPSIEISTNKHNKVLDATAVNDDGKDILDGMDLKKTDLKVAVNAIIGSMVQKGYVVDENSGILVTVQNKDSKKAQNIKDTVIADINVSLDEHKIAAPIINQTLTDFDSAEQFAKENNISYGKAVFVLKLTKKDSSLDAAALAKMSIKDITAVVKDKNIDIRDIVDYDYDDSIGENIADDIEDTNDDRYDDDDDDRPNTNGNSSNINSNINGNTNGNTDGNTDSNAITPSGSYITAEKAEEIALKHAGVSADNARFEKTELDRENNVVQYEIEFSSGNVEYDYEIDAVTGDIIDFEKDIDD